MSIVTLYPARIVERFGRRYWVCPNCGRTLAEMMAGRVIIKVHNRVIGFPAHAAMDQTCPRCGTVSVLDDDW